MNKIKPKNYTKSKKLICDWTDKKKYLIQYRMLKFYVRHGIVFEKSQESISFKQTKSLERYICFNTKKNETKLKIILRKTSINYLLMLLLVNFWKMFGIVSN